MRSFTALFLVNVLSHANNTMAVRSLHTQRFRLKSSKTKN